MLGTRGVRLGVVKPGLYAMQVRALMEAAADRGRGRRQAGRRDHDPAHRHPRGAGRWPAAGSRRPSPRPTAGRQARSRSTSLIGTMIETPRAALRADEIAEEADFFRFGTNDLTQMTFGFSRDDVEGRMMPRLPRAGAAEAQPVRDHRPGRRRRARAARRRAGPRDQARPQARRVRRARRRPRVDRPLLRARASTTCRCSPFRVPIARLAAAQAVLGSAVRGHPLTRSWSSLDDHPCSWRRPRRPSKLRQLRRPRRGSGPRSSALVVAAAPRRPAARPPHGARDPRSRKRRSRARSGSHRPRPSRSSCSGLARRRRRPASTSPAT